MSLLIKLAIPVLLVFSLVACKDVLNKPLSGMNVPVGLEPMEGSWSGEKEGTRLDIFKTRKAEWYEFTFQEPDKQTKGRFMVSYFKWKRVVNIDLASVRINGQPVVSDSSQAFLMVGANVEDEQLILIPADMDKFEKHFAPFFFASPIQAEALCKKDNELCMANFSTGNMLYSKRMKKFNDAFLKKYRTVFPVRNQMVFNSIKAPPAQ